MTGEFSFTCFNFDHYQLLTLYHIKLNYKCQPKSLPSYLWILPWKCISHISISLFIFLSIWDCWLSPPQKTVKSLNYIGLKKLWSAQGHTAIKWQGNFSKSRSWDSKSHVHSTPQQYPLQDHSCISIPEEAGQPTNLRPIKLRCPELQSTWYTTTTSAAKSQEQLHV